MGALGGGGGGGRVREGWREGRMEGRRRPTVAVEWVGKVVLEAGDGALALNGCLAGKAHKGNHGQSPILDLLFPGVIVPQL